MNSRSMRIKFDTLPKAQKMPSARLSGFEKLRAPCSTDRLCSQRLRPSCHVVRKLQGPSNHAMRDLQELLAQS